MSLTTTTLRSKTLVMLVGPSAIGKSTLMNEVIRQNTRFVRVKTFTSRQPRPNDEAGQYFYLSPDEIEVHRKNNEVISEVIFPTTGQTYGTLTRSYEGEYCLLDTLAGSVEIYRQLPFANTITITLTASADEWREWFITRYPDSSDEASKRLQEADLSINWSMNDPDTYWLVNTQGAVGTVARQLIDIVTANPPRLDTPDEPRAMLELIKRGVWT